MLVELHVKNYGLIDSLVAEFSNGLNVLSGETGVGKSMLVSALKLLLGARSSSSVIREGAEEASVTAVFSLSEPTAGGSHAGSGNEHSRSGDELILRRSLGRNGRSRCTINDEPVTAKRLGALARSLVDIHGQHEEQSLLDTGIQRRLLDRYGRTDGLCREFEAAFREWNEARRRHERLLEGQRKRLQELDLLKHQVEEIAAAAPEPGEHETLRRQQELANQLHDVLKAASSAQGEIIEDDGSILERIGAVRRALAPFASLHPTLEQTAEHLQEAQERLQQAGTLLSGFSSDQEYDPRQLETLEARLDLLIGLRLKYGNDEHEILAFAENAHERIRELSGQEEEAGGGEERIRQLESRAESLGEKLSVRRSQAAEKLSRGVMRELRSLGMQKAQFRVAFRRLDSLGDSDGSGLDRIELEFGANPGEGVLPLAEVASGGEVSRVFLAIKRMLAAVDPVPVMIFDEIDTNVGGRMGSVVGKKLAGLARNHQLICVTHLPQIASYADRHVKLHKETKQGRTRTVASRVEGQARLEELAEMIRGRGATQVTLKEAREMLAEARAARRGG